MNITKEEIKSAGLQHVEEVKGGNACYDSFVAGVEYMLQKLKQCNVSGSLPPLDDETATEPIQNALYATGKFTTDDCSILADGILQYIKDAKMSIVGRQ